LGLTQRDVARAVGVQFQQIQKYECGATRLTAVRLFALSRVLRVPIDFFFDGFSSGGGSGAAAEPVLPEEVFAKSETLELAHAADKMPSRARAALLAFAHSLCDDVAVARK
jgi:transcriptional regulator with XRE-family HTH domain